VLIASPRVDERVSIGAKTLSGFGYKGHVFWDTELFILPPLTLLQPDLTRRMLMYRYHNLAGARHKAQEAGYEGAMFPWESTDTGEETTPRWTNPHPVTGERVRIWTGDNEQHISTDIAYAVLHFWRNTGEDGWFADYGAEIVLDTAKFWGSRAEYNADKARYELRQQIGPDEYHENVDNSVFTNRMVQWHLQQAFIVLDWLKAQQPAAYERLVAALDLSAERLAHWQTVMAQLWIPMSAEGGGVFEQFEGFFDRLKPTNFEDYTPRTANMDWIMGHAKTQRTRIIKQADVVMLMALLGHELGDAAFLKRNWELYYPICDHGSSLSPSMHAWVAARLGYAAEAYDLFMYAATMDLDDQKGNVRDGIHAACCGGVLQAVIYGFCGLTIENGALKTQPALPTHWRRVAFTVHYQGKLHAIDLRN
jgi:kojibiose phosphorylase